MTPPSKSGGNDREHAPLGARAGWFSAGVVFFLVSTIVAVFQPGRPHPGKPAVYPSWDWFWYPGEENAYHRLAHIRADLNDIYSLPGAASGQEKVWAVGNLGLIVHSDDGGRTWRKQELPELSEPARRITGAEPGASAASSSGSAQPQPGASASSNQGGEPISQTQRPRSLPQSSEQPGGRTTTSPRDAGAEQPKEAPPVQQNAPPPEIYQQAAPELNKKENDDGAAWFRLPSLGTAAFAAEPAVEPKAQQQTQQQNQTPVDSTKTAAETDPDSQTGQFSSGAFDPGAFNVVGEPDRGRQTEQATPADQITTSAPDLIAVYFRESDGKSEGWAVTRLGSYFYFDDDSQSWQYGGSEVNRAGWPMGVPPDLPFGWSGYGPGSVATAVIAGSEGRPPGTAFRLAENTNRAGGLRGLFPAPSYGWVIRRGGALELINVRTGLQPSQLEISSADGSRVRAIGLYDPVAETSRILDDAPSVPVEPVVISVGWASVSNREHGHFISRLKAQVWDLSQSPGSVSDLQFRFQSWVDAEPPSAESADHRPWYARSFIAGRESGTAMELTEVAHTPAAINSIHFLPDNRHGWAAGEYGTILHTNDGGETWFPQTLGALAEDPESRTAPYSRSLPPWYFASWFVAGLLLAPALKKPKPPNKEERSVADLLVSDRPIEKGDPDPLDLNAIALGLSRFLRNENTDPPLTIAVTGEWGMGKSSLMNLLKAHLEEYRFRPVWFNAWHHQKEEHLLASLLQNLRLQAIPPWWHPQGWIFRARLLWVRGWRSWIPVLASLAVICFLAGLFQRMQTGPLAAFLAVLDMVTQIVEGNATKETAQTGTLSLVTLGTIYAAYRKLTAFGVNPASLLAARLGKSSVRELDAQTSFRKRFADQFREVTQALGPYRLVIFIDDLDRCRPSNVVEALEAVNFLVSSGSCFVVMGLDWTYVERCVGLDFEKVAEEMVDEVDDAGANVSKEGKSKQQRIRFARNYLQKLINIEVPIPEPSPEQAKALFTGDEARSDEALKREPLARRLAKLVPAATAIAVGALALYGALSLGQWISTHYRPLQGQTQAGFLAAPGAPSPGGQEPGPAQPQAPAPAPGSEQAIRPGQAPELVIGEPPGGWGLWLANWPILFLAAILTACAYWILTQRPDMVEKDSPEFTRALGIWYSGVIARKNTPRAAKRFVNRVRYFAMRQRPLKESLPPWKRALRWVGRFFGRKVEEPPGPVTAQEIPEPALVALAALHHIDPLAVKPETTALRKRREVKLEWKPLLDQHEKEFGADDLERHLGPFQTLARGINVN